MDKHFWTNKRILITGYDGFLGSWSTKALIDRQADAAGIDKAISKSRITAKTRTILGWKPKYTLRQGLDKTIQCYREHI